LTRMRGRGGEEARRERQRPSIEVGRGVQIDHGEFGSRFRFP